MTRKMPQPTRKATIGDARLMTRRPKIHAPAVYPMP
jgi:hypothetical protein